MKRCTLAALTVSAVAPFAFASVATLAAAPSTSTRTVNVAVGKTTSIVLAGNPSTGYSWKWTKAPASRIAKGGAPKVVPAKPGAPIGAPQNTTVRITGVATGTTRGVLSYVAPGTQKASKTVTVRITVRHAPTGA